MTEEAAFAGVPVAPHEIRRAVFEARVRAAFLRGEKRDRITFVRSFLHYDGPLTSLPMLCAIGLHQTGPHAPD